MNASIVEWGLALGAPPILFVLALRMDEETMNFVKIAVLSVPISLGLWFLFNATATACLR